MNVAGETWEDAVFGKAGIFQASLFVSMLCTYQLLYRRLQIAEKQGDLDPKPYVQGLVWCSRRPYVFKNEHNGG